MRRLGEILSLDDFEVHAKRRLPTSVFHYIASGAERGRSILGNREEFGRHAWCSRILVDTRDKDTATVLFGEKWAAPFGIAPLGLSALWQFDGDLALAEGALNGNVPMILSGSSLIPMEEVRSKNERIWFQAYFSSDASSIQALLERVASAGISKLVVTVDVPVVGNRENQIRAGFDVPLRPGFRLLRDGMSHLDWVLNTMIRTLLKRGIPHFENTQAGRREPVFSRSVVRDIRGRMALSWKNIAFIRRLWKSELILKGVLHSMDALHAKAEGVDGIILSNHGGRQLDGAVSPLSVLREIRHKMGPEFPVMLDGGVRRGSDVLVALALGASFVFVGRPFAYASAVAGQEGVLHCIRILAAEIARNLSLLGVSSPMALNSGYLHSS